MIRSLVRFFGFKKNESRTDRRQGLLLLMAGAFLFLFCTILSLSPAVRERTWSTDYRVTHWIGFGVWALLFGLAHRMTSLRLPDRDPYLLPLAGLLSGWGLLTVWRLDSFFGAKQALWLAVSTGVFLAILYSKNDIGFLRRYKYLLLTGGLGLTLLTLLFGTNPVGTGPRLWLGCCGFYLQPSEPLKLLLVAYLAAYFSDYPPVRFRLFPLIVPTILLTGMALLLLFIQRDLGTASIFILLYTTMLYLVTGRRRILLVTGAGLILAGLAGYFFVDVVHARLDAWLNPWADPTGRSYQIIQSLLAVANGGTFGRGPGIGNPGLVPIAISDFIYSSIAEETGLAGTIGLLTILGLLLARGLRAAFRAPDGYRRLLATGTTAYIGIQSLLIIGGNLRALPLTGVTLPFVSYGGSSLLTSFIALAILMQVGGETEVEPIPLANPRPYFFLGSLLGLGIAAVALTTSWWAVVRAPDLLARTDNPRRSIADRYVRRGSLLDINNQPIDLTVGESGSYARVYAYPDLAPITGYTDPTFGQAGLEESLDAYLRGLQGNPASLLWWDYLLYGTPPPGLDVRLSLDRELQKRADLALGRYKGAVLLMNATTGEILVMASHPTYDPNKLSQTGILLARDPGAPLVNRATQGLYLVGQMMAPFMEITGSADAAGDQQLESLYNRLGFYASPQIRMPVAETDRNTRPASLKVSPLHMVIAAASLSNNGLRPAARIAMAVDTPKEGWVVLPALDRPLQILTPEMAGKIALEHAVQGQVYWEWTGVAGPKTEPVAWYLGGTLPNWQGTPLAIVVLLEGDYPLGAASVGSRVLEAAIH